MQQATSKQLYAYWNGVRNGRNAPRRFEIEPAKLAPLLSETFIAECEKPLSYRFRLAGTKICEQFGRELRGGEMLDLWHGKDRQAFASLLRQVIGDAAVGHVLFDAYTDTGRQARFELVVMPLIHAGSDINRLLGAITAIDPPFWLGSAPLVCQEATEMQLIWPDGEPAEARALAGDRAGAVAARSSSPRRFRVYDGGAD